MPTIYEKKKNAIAEAKAAAPEVTYRVELITITTGEHRANPNPY